MKRPSGHTLALIGLFLGLTTGVLVVFFKNWLVKEIVSSLEDEVKASCAECSLAFDSFSLSFTTLGGRATNVRIMERGVPRLSFKKITAKADISQIREKKVFLKKLVLSNGIADGVGPDSVTFRFIDQLTTPLPPEKQRPNRWRVFLDELEVRDSFLREPLGTSELSGSGVALSVVRDGENFELKPYIADLRYTSFGKTPGAPPSELFLGPLSGSLVIEDAKTIFKSIALGQDQSHIAAQAELDTDHGNQLSGLTSFNIIPPYVGLPDWLQGSITGSTDITGNIGSPILSGNVQSSPTNPLTLALPHASQLALQTMTGKLTVDVNRGDPIVTLNTLSGGGDTATIASTEPLVLSDKGLSAGFDLMASDFSYGPFSIHNAKARISIRESSEGISTTFAVEAGDLKLQGVSLGPSNIDVRLDPRTVDIATRTTNPIQGSLTWDGSIDIESNTPAITQSTLTLERYRYPLAIPIDANALGPLEITATLSMKGPLDMGKLSASGETKVSFPALPRGMPLTGKTTLKDGMLKISLPESSFRGSAELSVDFVRTLGGKLQLTVPRMKAREIFEDEQCGELGGALNYSFQLAAPLLGTGELALETFRIGCAPYALSIPDGTEIPIKTGSLQLKNVAVSSLDSSLALNGEVGIARGFDLTAKGKLELSALLPLLPAIDDLQGSLIADLALTGPLSTPLSRGTARLSRGQFGISSPDLGAHDIEGAFNLAGNQISIESLRGSANNGTFAISGNLLPFNWPLSTLTASLQEVTIEPMEDASITFSGDLRLGAREGKRQTLSGEIAVNFAEVSKDFDLNKLLLNAITGYFLPARIQPVASRQKVDIDLDVGISAPRNVFVITPFFSAEMNTNIRALGTITEPSLRGSMQILSGWVGLKGNRFDVTSGGLFFSEGSLMPTLEISSEGTLRAPTGENVLVILDASGPLQNPKIEVSSDRGLSQSELLLLLTSSRSLGGSTRANRFGGQFASEQRFFISEDSFTSLRGFLRNLTRLDTLSFEPAYNQFTGTIEPAVVARKNLSPRLTLVGESLFSSVSNSRAGGVYSLTPSLNINGFFQTVSTQKNSIVSSDLTYTVLSEQSEFVSFTIEGLREFDQESILSAARVGSSSRIVNNSDGLRTIERQILNYMNDQGYREAAVSVSCRRGERYCYEIVMSISEGEPSTIGAVVFEGSPLPDELRQAVLSIAPIDSIATATKTAAIERKLVLALRNEGFIAARVAPQYRSGEASHRPTLAVVSDIREPISFIFSGNTVFSAEDFLDSIELFSRKRPFGNNTIKLLVQNIERMYQARGYLFVQVSYVEDRSNPERLVYTITINEESPSEVRSLTLTGNQQLSRERIMALMGDIGLGDKRELFDPTYAIPDDLDTLRDAIYTVYQQEGFTQASVSYQIKPSRKGDALDIEFTIQEGEAERIRDLRVIGFPSELARMTTPKLPASSPRVNKFVEEILENLRGEGFLFPSVTVDPSEDGSAVTVSVEPGDATIVTNISYEGLAEISEETAKRSTQLAVGNRFRAEDSNGTKRELLRSGLFSRVEVVPQDGAFDSSREAIIVRLVERPLQTLEIGAGANSEFGLHTFGETVNKSLFADGRTLSLRVDTYFDQARINPGGGGTISQGFTSARYSDPSFLDSDYQLTEEARYQRQELSTQEFNLDRVLLGSYLFRQYDSNLTFSAGHSLLFDNLQDVTPGAIISDLDDGSVRLSFLSGVLKFDRRDDPLLPRSGYTLAVEPKLSMVGIGSQANFGSVVARTTSIVPLDFASPRYSLGLGLSGGLSQPWGDTEEIPITQRFYLGGRTTVRGFRENSLGPRGSDGAVIGGDTLLAGKAQFQYLALDSLSTHVFFDVGNVFLRHEDFALSDLRTSTGVGFQYLSPIGPIGFDIGHPLDERSGEPSVRVHFSVGSMF